MKKVLAIGMLAVALAALAAGAMLWDGIGTEATLEKPAMGRVPLGQELSLCDPSIPPCDWPPKEENRP